MWKDVVFIMLCFGLMSCKSSGALNDNVVFNPYEKGDILVFEDSYGEVDSVFIRKIVRGKGRLDQLNPFATKYATYSVIADTKRRTPKRNKNGGVFEFSQNVILSIGENNNARCEDNIGIGITSLAWKERHWTKSFCLSDFKVTNKTTNYGGVVYEITDTDVTYSTIDIKRILFHEKLGYLRIEDKEDSWSLKHFFRKGIDILN